MRRSFIAGGITRGRTPPAALWHELGTPLTFRGPTPRGRCAAILLIALAVSVAFVS